MIFFNGSTGGLGRYLATELASLGLENNPLGTRLEDSGELEEELDAKWRASDQKRVVLLHLAALVSVPKCESDPEHAFAVNVTAADETVTAFAGWAWRHNLEPAVIYVSSGHVYAPPDPPERLVETAPTEPKSVYARTKLEAEHALAEAARTIGFQLTVARVFGLVAPGQPDHYLLPGLIRRARTGDVAGVPGLMYVRDYLDSRDVCLHLATLAHQLYEAPDGPEETFNICSGEETPIRHLLEMAIREVRKADPESVDAILETMTSAPGRATDIPWLVGDPTRFLLSRSESMRSIPLKRTVREAASWPHNSSPDSF